MGLGGERLFFAVLNPNTQELPMMMEGKQQAVGCRTSWLMALNSLERSF
jgi:hypothetical protein